MTHKFFCTMPARVAGILGAALTVIAADCGNMLIGDGSAQNKRGSGTATAGRDRRIKLDAAIAPSGANNLFSITAMELLDLMPNPLKGCLVGVHGDEYLNELD